MLEIVESELLHTIFLRQRIYSRHLSLLQVVPCYPEPSDTSPKRAREGRQRVEETVVDDLISNSKRNICEQSQDDLGHRDLGQDSLTEAHGVDREVTARQRKLVKEEKQ